MRTTLLVACLLLLVSSVSATEKWVYPGEAFTFGDETYYAFTDNSRTSAIIQSNDTRLIIDLGACEREAFSVFCFEDVATQLDLDYIKYDTDGNILYAMQFSYETLGPKVDIKQSYSTKTPDINDRVDGTITVTNTGNERAYDITVTWIANGTVVLRSCSECERGMRTFTKTFSSLAVDEEKTVVFSFDVPVAESFETNASVTYEYEGTNGSDGPLIQSFGIKSPYKLSMSKSATTQVGDWIDASVTVQNTGQNTITIDVEQKEHPQVNYKSGQFEDIRDLQDAELDPGESASYAFSMLSNIAGEYETSFDVTIEREGETFTDSVSQTFGWTLDELGLITQLGKLEPVSGDANTLYVNVQNGGDITFRNLEVSYDGEIADTTTIPNIGTDRVIEVFEEPFRHPRTGTRLDRTIEITLTYETQFGEPQEETDTIEYSVIPLNESYELRRVISPSEPEQGEVFTVSVYGTKTVDSAVKYTHVEDRLVGAELLRGNQRLIPIESDEEELLYEYEAERTGADFAVITSVDASFLNETARISEWYSTYDIDQEAVDETIDSTEAGTIERVNETSGPEPEPEAEPEAEPEPVQEPEEESGDWLTKVLRWFADLF